MNAIFTLPAYVGIILQQADKVLLVRRHNTDWASGKWNFPGGLLEKGETLVQAALREAREEVGVTIATNDLELVHVLQVYASATNTKDILGFYFLVTRWEKTAVNNEPDRHAEIGWFSIDALPSSTTAHALKALQGIASGTHFSVD